MPKSLNPASLALALVEKYKELHFIFFPQDQFGTTEVYPDSQGSFEDPFRLLSYTFVT
jgi:hypothetical protein